jgi:hypothetical protein
MLTLHAPPRNAGDAVLPVPRIARYERLPPTWVYVSDAALYVYRKIRTSSGVAGTANGDDVFGIATDAT